MIKDLHQQWPAAPIRVDVCYYVIALGYALTTLPPHNAVQLMAQHLALTYGNIFEIRPAGDMNEIMTASEQRRRKNSAR